MQFHLDGFRPGDPDIHAPAEQAERVTNDLPDEVDVLIVGCGPAGLTLAAYLAGFPDIHTRIIEQKDGPLLLGQADGVACRTMEMFNAYGFAERVMREAYWVNETSFWRPDEADSAKIVRSGRIQDVEDDLSEFPHVILNQARVHDFYLEVMRNSPTRLEPDYSRRLLNLTIEEEASGGDYPVIATIEASKPPAKRQTIRARYLVGCDGARSTVRKSLDLSLEGDSSNQAWGVMDVLAVTDFPDIRLKAAIHSANEGNLLIIPREGGYLVRLYIELEKLHENERVASRKITKEHLVAAAARILHPYKIEVKEVAWWSVYEIGQRLCEKFDNVAAGETGNQLPRVFIAGDACHTHSPKAGQGMNVSMRDSFNLAWKLVSVLRGQSPVELLHTYSSERQTVAKELIDFDREFAKMFSAPPRTGNDIDEAGIDPAEFQKYFVKQGRFTAGTIIQYYPSIISAEPQYQHLAEGLVVGRRFHSAPVIRLADAKPVQLGHAIKSDGRWRLFLFADPQGPADRSAISALCRFLLESSHSPVCRYTKAGDDLDSVIDVRAVFQQRHQELELSQIPALLLPGKGRYGLLDYEKVHCPDYNNSRDIYQMRGISREGGCIVVVRPDQHVAQILPLEAHESLAEFFSAFMIDADSKDATS